MLRIHHMLIFFNPLFSPRAFFFSLAQVTPVDPGTVWNILIHQDFSSVLGVRERNLGWQQGGVRFLHLDPSLMSFSACIIARV
jgi:hypothetical protein